MSCRAWITECLGRATAEGTGESLTALLCVGALTTRESGIGTSSLPPVPTTLFAVTVMTSPHLPWHLPGSEPLGQAQPAAAAH